MKKYQRARKRIARDKKLKAEKLEKLYGKNDDYQSVISMQHFQESLNKCRKGVNWKCSVQEYTENAIVEMNKHIRLSCNIDSRITQV